MNEGIISTQLGLPGMPAIAEELMISRDIELCKYTHSKIHFTGISTKKSIEIIKQAKKDGMNVTCSVTPYHLFFTDADLVDYETNLKVNPPLRTKKDKDALIEAVIDGTVDCIATHHLPQDVDCKIVEFENAKNGMIGLETCFAVLRTSIPELSIERIVELLCTNPRKIFDIKKGKIEKDAEACFTLFDVDASWTVDKNYFASKCSNSPFIGKQLVGKPLGIINKERLFLNEF
jgi:dihydroorotase